MAFGRRETAILLIGDFLILVASLWMALLIRNLSIPPLGYFWNNFVPFVTVFCISLVIFYISGLYEKQTRPIRRVMGTRILGALSATVAIAAIFFFILPLSIAPKTILVLYLIASFAFMSAWRFWRMKRELKEENRVPATLIASGPAAQELYDEVNGNGQYLIYFTAHEHTDGPGRIDIHAKEGTIVTDFVSFYEEIFDRVPLAHVTPAYFIDVFPRQRTLYDLSKRLFDITLALVGSVLALPFILIGVCGRLATHTPVFFLHDRIGQGGRPFTLIKLSSMAFNDHGDPELQQKNHVTAFGSFLRKTRIDELPQLWNVLTGDLSFIGPRPELPSIAVVYEKEIPNYQMRHRIVPGLSGWAQIHDYDAPRGGADVPRTARKLSFDLYYLTHRSFGLDLAIAIKTIRALLSFSGS